MESVHSLRGVPVVYHWLGNYAVKLYGMALGSRACVCVCMSLELLVSIEVA